MNLLQFPSLKCTKLYYLVRTRQIYFRHSVLQAEHTSTPKTGQSEAFKAQSLHDAHSVPFKILKKRLKPRRSWFEMCTWWHLPLSPEKTQRYPYRFIFFRFHVSSDVLKCLERKISPKRQLSLSDRCSLKCLQRRGALVCRRRGVFPKHESTKCHLDFCIACTAGTPCLQGRTFHTCVVRSSQAVVEYAGRAGRARGGSSHARRALDFHVLLKLRKKANTHPHIVFVETLTNC